MRRPVDSNGHRHWLVPIFLSALFGLLPAAGYAQNCVPTPDGMGCEIVDCPTDECQPVAVEINPLSGIVRITDCDCSPTCYLNVVFNGQFGSASDNGTGTIDFPPQACGYDSPDDLWSIIDGLPPGDTIEIDGPIRAAVIQQRYPGGMHGGEMQDFIADFDMQMTGTGSLTGFNRTVSLALQCQTHTGPPQPGDPVQRYPATLFRLHGSLYGDPDFDMLGIYAGDDFGLPSPGETVITRLPSGDFAVDSFFDIAYRIDFVGAPGGVLDGLSGSTMGMIQLRSGTTVSCVGELGNCVCEPQVEEIRPGVYRMHCGLPWENADFDDDGDMDGRDFLIWQAAFLTSADGDANCDTISDGEDLLVWQAQFGLYSQSSLTVPEPCTLLLWIVAQSMIHCRNQSWRLFR